MQPEIKVERWEADEYVLTFLGSPQGQTLNLHDAHVVANWLRTVDFEQINKNLRDLLP
jgi:hypothetical protein